MIFSKNVSQTFFRSYGKKNFKKFPFSKILPIFKFKTPKIKIKEYFFLNMIYFMLDILVRSQIAQDTYILLIVSKLCKT